MSPRVKVTGPPLMKPGEVADAFGVDAETVRRWAIQGRLRSIRTPGGGSRRYDAAQVREVLAARDGGGR